MPPFDLAPNLETTLRDYFGRNAQQAAEAAWDTVAEVGDTSQNEENPKRSEGKEVSIKKQVKRAAEESRTPDLRITNASLCQLSYGGFDFFSSL